MDLFHQGLEVRLLHLDNMKIEQRNLELFTYLLLHVCSLLISIRLVILKLCIPAKRFLKEIHVYKLHVKIKFNNGDSAFFVHEKDKTNNT